MLSYPVHRHRLPDSASRTSRSSGDAFSAGRATVAITNPGVQNPHWNEWLSQKAYWTG